MTSDELFLIAGRSKVAPRVLEMGTRRSNPAVSTVVAEQWFSDMSLYVRTDIEDGEDVDMVCDAHELYRGCSRNIYGFRSGNKFDIIISRSVFEHLAKPWVVAEQMGFCLNPGGIVFVQTHQTFPIHGYPSDYWRFTDSALEVLFSRDAGFDPIKADYKFPARIHAAEVPGMESHPAYLNVNIFARSID